MSAQSELLTLREAAGFLRLSVATLRAWRAARRFLPFVKLGGKIMLRKSDCEKFIAASVVPAKASKRAA